MISDIKHILNLRYDATVYSGDSTAWNTDNFSDDISCIKRVLKEPPRVFDHFKLVLQKDGRYFNENSPSNDVFCRVDQFEVLHEIIKNEESNNFSNLVCGGGDGRLSSNIEILDQIKNKFNKIYYEAKDVECDWVQTIPMGMIMAYMLRNGGNDVILAHINKKKTKTKLIASAFGSKWPGLTKQILDRKKLKRFTKRSNLIDDMFCPPHEYYERLCDYRYFASPLGKGIQTPKICECVMCETVPVVTDHVAHRELRDIYNLPLLIVNDWADLTEKFLNDQWNSVYSKIDWDEQKSKFLVKNFNKLLI